MNQSNYKYRVRADYWIDLPTIDNESEIFALKKQIEKFIENESGVTHSISTASKTYQVRVETCVVDIVRQSEVDSTEPTRERVELYDEFDNEWQSVSSNVHQFTEQELDIVLAGLRTLQQRKDCNKIALRYGDLISPDNDKIDRLCEIINFNHR
ncbi:hypothetical protein [Chamaesiphon polymorphus]|uniref:Uncharacterized protein n=1 Tax=Chamaesiphon polymorphus CCALA 037 TaxID=2107692 RepID=A0A2T1FV36_9CYAN|nr:hypothetical protein [Chamaesiphon polymorphus]PSB48821.1 hypothetical protein C7B77_23710 [Chamaesiphon polymorphus CCALA 037]